MPVQLMILPTAEALEANKEVFAQLPPAGLPMMLVAQFMIDRLMDGDPTPLAVAELNQEWMEYLLHNQLMTDRLAQLCAQESVTQAIYALYLAMHALQETVLTLEQGQDLTSMTVDGWQGRDVIVARHLVNEGTHSAPIVDNRRS